MNWISVNDRLPEEGEEVLVVLKSDRVFYYIAELTINAPYPFWWSQDRGLFTLDEITHWMPLPEPPEEPTP